MSPSRKSTGSDGLDPLGLRTLGALADLELDALALIEGLEPRALNLRVVHEDVGAIAVLLDEAEALLAVEPLHTAACHCTISLWPLNQILDLRTVRPQDHLAISVQRSLTEPVECRHRGSGPPAHGTVPGRSPARRFRACGRST